MFGKKRANNDLLRRLQTIARKRLPWRETAERVRQRLVWWREFARLLDPEASPMSVRERRTALEASLSSATEIDGEFAAHVQDQWTKWQPGLLTCYEHPSLPRTNNALEGFFRKVKGKYRKITGRQRWHSYLQRYGAEAMILASMPEEAWDSCVHADRALWRQNRKAMRDKHAKLAQFRRFQGNPSAYLEKIEQLWLSESSVS